jgi:YcxB-like protein
MIVAFSYFFILIDEQKILWQLSPLFFGMPIVAIVGQFLRIHASYRKHIANLSESEKKLHYMFPENGDGIEIVNGKNFSHVAWESVRGVRERPRYFRLALNGSESIIIPKRFFSQSSDAKLLREILRFHFGSKAKLSE